MCRAVFLRTFEIIGRTVNIHHIRNNSKIYVVKLNIWGRFRHSVGRVNIRVGGGILCCGLFRFKVILF